MAFLLAVVSFVGSTAFAAHRLEDVSARSNAISADAMPAVIALALTRQAIGTLRSEVSSALDTGAALPPDMDRRAAEIRTELCAYEVHAASLPGQRQSWLAARALIEEAVVAAERIRTEREANHPLDARSAQVVAFRASASAADAELLRLVELNATEGARLAEHIDAVRRRTTLWLVLLDLACAGFAGALTVFAQRAVTRSTELLEARSQELELFAARVAHDVRGPLSPVVFALGALSKDPELSDARRTMIDRAVRSVARVTTLIDDLLAFARGGGRVDRSARTSVLGVARATVEEVGPRATAQGIELHLDLAAQDAEVACSPGVLTSLVSNLVQNAIKYMGTSRERRITVRSAVIGARARVEVEDTGPGLPPGTESKVFEPYVRADGSGQPGLGLGLATVKRLSEAHGGAVGVRSSPAGCTFWFELPVFHGGAGSR